MSNLSKRVEKAKKLNYSHSPYTPGVWGTWGSNDKEYGRKYYRIELSHQKETIRIETPDRKENKIISVFVANCQKDTGNGQTCNCPGNERHTVCYHSLGAIYRSFEQAKVKRLVSFFESYESATRMAFGGKVCKVRSDNGPGVVWCVVGDWPESKEQGNEYYLKHGVTKEGEDAIRQKFSYSRLRDHVQVLETQRNINLMRGNEDDEGID
jgi:hypothetical protein